MSQRRLIVQLVCVQVYVHVQAQVYPHFMYMSMHISMHMSMHIHMHMSVHSIHVHTHVHAYMSIHMSMHISIHMFIHTSTRIHVHRPVPQVLPGHYIALNDSEYSSAWTVIDATPLQVHFGTKRLGWTTYTADIPRSLNCRRCLIRYACMH